MKTIRLVFIAFVLTFTLMGCASSTIDTWADRGLEGVNYGQMNVEVFIEQINKGLSNQREADIDAVFDDILDIANGNVEGQTVDAEVLQVQRDALRILLRFNEANVKNVQASRDRALENLRHVAEAFEQIKRLRKSWSKTDDLQSRIDQLAGLVSDLVKQNATK